MGLFIEKENILSLVLLGQSQEDGYPNTFVHSCKLFSVTLKKQRTYVLLVIFIGCLKPPEPQKLKCS